MSFKQEFEYVSKYLSNICKDPSDFIFRCGFYSASSNDFLFDGDFAVKYTGPKESSISISGITHFGFYNIPPIPTLGPIGGREGVFENCEFLQHLILPKELVYLEEGFCAFCSNLESVMFRSVDSRIENFVFMDCPKLKVIFVPNGFSVRSLPTSKRSLVSFYNSLT